MKTETIFSGTPATLEEILDARSRRAEHQKELLQSGGSCLISFSLNIPGAIKQFPLARAAFLAGIGEIRKACSPEDILSEEIRHLPTGSEAFFLLSLPPREVKQAMVRVEESHPLGRLYDLDVLDSQGHSLSRSDFGLPARTCLVCGEPAKLCARSRAHSMDLVLWRTAQILNDYFRSRAADQAAACAVRALLYEVSSTPKPGLVDRNNSGSHQDMNFFTFLDSSAALIPWFRDFFCLGWDHSEEPEETLFLRLRFAGQQAEQDMFRATGGVNTHKGLIFSFSILCAALGKVRRLYGTPADRASVLSVCRTLGACSLKDFDLRPSSTAGEQCHAAYGLTGARGEAAAGFPSAETIGLPALKHFLAAGYSLNDASVMTLLSLIASVDDTNMIRRGGISRLRERKKEARRLLSEITPDTFTETLTHLDVSYIRDHLSPGGCADLLAVSLMFHFLEESGLLSVISQTDS